MCAFVDIFNVNILPFSVYGSTAFLDRERKVAHYCRNVSKSGSQVGRKQCKILNKNRNLKKLICITYKCATAGHRPASYPNVHLHVTLSCTICSHPSWASVFL